MCCFSLFHKTLKALFLASVVLSVKAEAHPVSFTGAKGIMGFHSPIISHNQLNYSFRHWFALGVHYVKRPSLDQRDGVFVTANFLLKRWNGAGSQANLYTNLGLGQGRLSDESQPSAFGLVQFDIENRGYYFLAKHLRIQTEDRVDLDQSVVRLGIAPYVVDYEGLHSWLILETQNLKFNDGESILDMTPFLRVFYKNLLFEIGQSFDGVTKFNYIAHF